MRRWLSRYAGPGGALAVITDVSDPGEVEGMVGRVAHELGQLDVMVATT